MNHDELAVDNNNELKNIIVLAFKHLSDHSFDEHTNEYEERNETEN